VLSGLAPLSANRRTALAAAFCFSFALHGLLYFVLKAQKPSLPRLEVTNSALFGATFEIDTVPSSAEARGDGANGATNEPGAVGAVGAESEGGAEAEAPSEAQGPDKVDASESAPAEEKKPTPPPKAIPKPSSAAPSPPINPPAPAPTEGASASPSPRAPSSASAPTAASSPPGTSGSEPNPSSGAYGQQGVARARASLFAAFVRTLPLAGKLLPAWLDAPLDEKQKVLVELRVDASGHLHEIEIVRGDTKSVLARTALKNEAFLSRGTFAIQGEREGQMLIELSSEIQQRAPSEEEDAATKVVSLGQRIPDSAPGQPPTGAYFTYGNGRHIELRASIVDIAR